MGHMGDERAALLAAGITRDIGWIVANCELAPAADAALHPIIGRLAADAAALKSHPGEVAPIASMRDAMADYAWLFDDPGNAAPREACGEPSASVPSPSAHARRRRSQGAGSALLRARHAGPHHVPPKRSPRSTHHGRESGKDWRVEEV